MKTIREKAQRLFEQSLLTAGILMAVAVLVYALAAYPFYTRMKMGLLTEAYREIADVDLAAIDEEDEEVLRGFEVERLEFLITDETLQPVYYTPTSQTVETRIEKSITAYLDQFQEKPKMTVRSYRNIRVLRMRAKLQQDGKTYYLHIRSEMRFVREFIYYTTFYFCVAVLLVFLAAEELRRRHIRRMPQEHAAEHLNRTQEQIDAAQREFVANVSHELKTPLAVISGQVEMLQCMGDGIDKEYYFSSIREEIDKMSDMVGDLLDLTVMDHQMEKMEMSSVDLTEMMEYMMLKYDALFKKNRIKVQASLAKNCVVHGNRMYLEQAVNNYIMNAFQHTAQGKGIELRLLRIARGTRIEIYNDGPLIPEEDLDRIWKSYYMKTRSNAKEAAKISNAGLGLYMVKRIVEQHGGRCGVVNKEKGVEFWMEILQSQEK